MRKFGETSSVEVHRIFSRQGSRQCIQNFVAVAHSIAKNPQTLIEQDSQSWPIVCT